MPLMESRKLVFSGDARSPSLVLWNCARRANSVVTTDVPTLLPMFRMKLTRPATALFFSGAIPVYAAVEDGMNTKPNGTYSRMRSQVAEAKLSRRSILRVEEYIDQV